MNYVMYFDIAALILMITIMVHYLIKKNINTLQTHMFLALLILEFISTVVNIVLVFMYDKILLLPSFVNYGMNEIYLITFNILTPVYFYYFCLNIKKRSEFSVLWKIMIFVPALVDIVLISTTSITKGVFYIDVDGTYRQGVVMPLLYVIACYYLTMCISFVFRYYKSVSKTQRISICFFNFAMLVSVILQMTVLKKIMITEFAAAVSLLMVYMSLEDPNDNLDIQLGCYNRNAFVRTVSYHIEDRKKFDILGIQIEGFRYINDTIGVNNANILLKQVVDTFKKLDRNDKVFHISGTRFAILSEHREQQWDNRVKAINDRFKYPFLSQEMEIPLAVLMCSVSYPRNVQNLEDILDMLESVLREHKKSSDKGMVAVSDEELGIKRRENRLIHIMRSALRDEEFEVYYQPIYSVEKKRFTCAEALIRLKNNELGYVSPEEFIPLAEKNGLILEIGEFVFRNVCQFMAQEKLLDKGIEYIEINLSVVQCMQERMHEILINIIDSYKVPHTCINLEITETSAVVSSETLKSNMDYLRKEGVTFALDDYGTGYSNISNIISYPFSIIKLDKSMIWLAFEQPKALCALKYTIEMIKHMEMKIVAEGVETLEQAKTLAKFGCDYFQGYYYSKPVPTQKFLEVLESKMPSGTIMFE